MSSSKKNIWFSFLFGTRVKVCRKDTVILNLSLLFSVLALCTAPWLVVGGLIAALLLGYQFSIEKNAPQFSASFDEVVRDAAQNVRDAVDGKEE